ncbi:MAG: hypothetical protein IKB56_01630, partial [Clostridia bacterium]|nr:hypothetical protein [Clostridia bacterium]
GLAFGSDSGAGNIFAQLYQATSNGTTFYVYAKPNDGYYFAGFTNDRVFNTNYDTELSSSNPNYVLDTTNIEYAYKYTINIPTSSIPLDGVIEIQAYFKAIPTTGYEEYTYDKNPKSYEVEENELANVLNAQNMGAEYIVLDSSSDIIYDSTVEGTEGNEGAINVGTYTTVSYVTWNSIVVGKKTEEFTIIPREITAKNFTVIGNTKTYDGTIDWDSGKVTHGWDNIIGADVDGNLVYLTFDTVLSNKNAGVVDVLVSNIVLVGSVVNGFDISRNYTLLTTEATISQGVTINQREVTVTFKALDKFYDGTDIATVEITSMEGVIVGESIIFEDLSATFEDAEVGRNKVVTLAVNPPVASVGNDSTLLSNYIIITNSDSLTARIMLELGAIEGDGENHIHITQVTEDEDMVPYCDAVYEVETTKTGYELAGLYAIYESGELAINDYYGAPLKLALTKVEDMANGNTRWVIYGISGKCKLYAEWKAGTVAVTWNVASGLTLSSRPTVYVEKGLSMAEMPYATGSGNTYFNNISVSFTEWNGDFTALQSGTCTGYIPTSAVSATVTYNAAT